MKPDAVTVAGPGGLLRRFRAAAPLLLLVAATGCSSLGSFAGIPAVPVERVPREFFGRSKSTLVQISMTRLRQAPPAVYQLAANDVLGVYIENVIGKPDEAPPVHFPEQGDQPPSIGFPIPVREDGSLALPLVDPIQVAGMTLEQATEAIRRAYTVDKRVLKPGEDRIIVTLARRRMHRVLVVREEEGAAAGQSGGGGRGGRGTVNLGSSKRGQGYVVDLPAYENDLLHALNETGGLPGLDARNEVLILRSGQEAAAEYDSLVASLNNGIGECGCCLPVPDAPGVVKVPIRFYPDQPPRFTEDDVILNTGDIVYIQSRESEQFYTGGLLGGGQFLLPRDYDIDILQAVSLAGGQVGGGGSGIGQAGGRGGGGVGGGGGGGGRGLIPPSRAIIVRKIPCYGEIPILVNLNEAISNPAQRILIQPNDTIIVQYTLAEEVANAALSLVRFNFLTGLGGGGIR